MMLKHHIMKMYETVEVFFHALILALDRDQWLASQCIRLPYMLVFTGQRSWVDPNVSLDVVGRKIPTPAKNHSPQLINSYQRKTTLLDLWQSVALLQFNLYIYPTFSHNGFHMAHPREPKLHILIMTGYLV
jgi:hypothetical protein